MKSVRQVHSQSLSISSPVVATSKRFQVHLHRDGDGDGEERNNNNKKKKKKKKKTYVRAGEMRS